MKYRVTINANKENSLCDDYTWERIAWLDDTKIAIHYDEKNYIGSVFPYPVYDEYVEAETGSGAIWKLEKWIHNGNPRSWLLEK